MLCNWRPVHVEACRLAGLCIQISFSLEASFPEGLPPPMALLRVLPGIPGRVRILLQATRRNNKTLNRKRLISVDYLTSAQALGSSAERTGMDLTEKSMRVRKVARIDRETWS